MSFETVGMSSRNRYGGSASCKPQMSLPVSVKKTHSDFGGENVSPQLAEPKQSTMRAFSNFGLVDLKDPEGMSSLGHAALHVRSKSISAPHPRACRIVRIPKAILRRRCRRACRKNFQADGIKFDTLWAYAEPERKSSSSQLRQDAQRVIERYEQGRLERSKRTERTGLGTERAAYELGDDRTSSRPIR